MCTCRRRSHRRGCVKAQACYAILPHPLCSVFADLSVGEGSHSAGLFAVVLRVCLSLTACFTAGASIVPAYVKRHAQLEIPASLLPHLKDHENEASSVMLGGIVRSAVARAASLPAQLRAWLPTTVELDDAGRAAASKVLELHSGSYPSIASEGALADLLVGPLHFISLPRVPLKWFGFVNCSWQLGCCA